MHISTLPIQRGNSRTHTKGYICCPFNQLPVSLSEGTDFPVQAVFFPSEVADPKTEVAQIFLTSVRVQAGARAQWDMASSGKFVSASELERQNVGKWIWK